MSDEHGKQHDAETAADEMKGADRRCLSCGASVTADAPTLPFCSPRCRMADLGKWFSGDYMISRPLEQRDIEDGE